MEGSKTLHVTEKKADYIYTQSHIPSYIFKAKRMLVILLKYPCHVTAVQIFSLGMKKETGGNLYNSCQLRLFNTNVTNDRICFNQIVKSVLSAICRELEVAILLRSRSFWHLVTF